MLERIQPYASSIYTILVGLFFSLILTFKLSYSLIPILLCLSGLFVMIKTVRQGAWSLDVGYKWLIGSFVLYFLLFALSVILHNGKMRELDLASRSLLALPIIPLLMNIKIKQKWVIYSLPIACVISGLVALIQVLVLKMPMPFPYMMHIQAGDIAMTLSLFALAVSFYLVKKGDKIGVFFSLIAFALGLVASLLTTARGAWLALPVILIILWLNRQIISKWLVIAMVALVVIGGVSTSDIIYKRYQEAEKDIMLYINENNGGTSVGARFDMWKSAWIGIQERPIFGWGIEGVKEMRKKHVEDKLIHPYAGSFAHAHNQFLHDASTRGVLGLSTLLAVFFIPLILFWRNCKRSSQGSLANLWGTLGITHILSTMAYCLSQAFFAHNSGAMFYFVTVAILLALQKTAKQESL